MLSPSTLSSGFQHIGQASRSAVGQPLASPPRQELIDAIAEYLLEEFDDAVRELDLLAMRH